MSFKTDSLFMLFQSKGDDVIGRWLKRVGSQRLSLGMILNGRTP